MIRTGWLAALLVALTPWTCPGQVPGGVGFPNAPMPPYGPAPYGPAQGEEEWTVKVETFGNQAVTGKLRLGSIAITCDLGLYMIKPGKIKSIELAPPKGQPIQDGNGMRREGAVITMAGEKVTGTVHVPDWTIETDLGMLTPDPQNLKTLTFLARAKDEEKKP